MAFFRKSNNPLKGLDNLLIVVALVVGGPITIPAILLYLAVNAVLKLLEFAALGILAIAQLMAKIVLTAFDVTASLLRGIVNTAALLARTTATVLFSPISLLIAVAWGIGNTVDAGLSWVSSCFTPKKSSRLSTMTISTDEKGNMTFSGDASLLEKIAEQQRKRESEALTDRYQMVPSAPPMNYPDPSAPVYAMPVANPSYYLPGGPTMFANTGIVNAVVITEEEYHRFNNNRNK